MKYATEKWYSENYLSPASPTDIIEQPPLRWGQIYTFGYDPKWKDKLSFYDNGPIILALGRKKDSNPPLELGLNLAFIPPKIRIAILDKVYTTYIDQYDRQNMLREAQKIDTSEPVPIGYYIAKEILLGSGFEFALRSYLLDHTMSPFRLIPQAEWWRTGLFSSRFIVKQNKWWIYYRYKLSSNPSYRIGTKETPLKL